MTSGIAGESPNSLQARVNTKSSPVDPCSQLRTQLSILFGKFVMLLGLYGGELSVLLEVVVAKTNSFWLTGYLSTDLTGMWA